jgi:Mce-associated membrane protein
MTDDAARDDAVETADAAPAAVPDAADGADGADAAERRKPTKAERLEAKAARLRAAEERRREAAEQRDAVGRQPALRGWLIATAVLSVVTAGLVVVLVLGYLSWQHQRDLDTARTGALTAAKAFAVDFGSYDYQHLDTEFGEVATKMTPSFAKSYLETSNKLKPTFTQYKVQVTARVQGAGVTSASTSKAVVVLFLDQTVKNSQSSTPRIDRNRLEIDLVKSKGRWLVDKVLAR